MAIRAENVRLANRRRARSSAVSLHSQALRRIQVATEASWLIAIVLVPFIVFPDSEFISRVGIAKTVTLRLVASATAILLVTNITLRLIAQPPRWSEIDTQGTSVFSSLRIFIASPRGLLLASVGLVALSTLISSAASILPSASLWGKDPGNEGYGLYTMASLWVIFAAIAFGVRSRGQFWRLLAAVSISGGLLAVASVAQHLGIWPVRETYYLGRSSGNLGNPIALGAFLALTFPVAIAMAAVYVRPRLSTGRWFVVAASISFMFLYGIQLTLSRGPYIAVAVTVVTLLALLWIYQGRKITVELGGPVVTALAVIVVISLGQLMPDAWLTADFGESAEPAESASYDSSPEPADGNADLESRLATQSTVRDRIEVWGSTVDLLRDRPPVPGADGAPQIVRHLVGYGPETYRYTLPLEASPFMLRRLTSEAHNDYLHRAVETGLLGLGVFLLLLLAVGRILYSSLRSGDLTETIVAIALGSALAGRLVEQTTGVSRVSDNLLFWVLIAAVSLLPVVFSRRQSVPAGEAAANSDAKPVVPSARDAVIPAFSVMLASAVIVAILFTAWQRNILYAVADHEAMEARQMVSVDPLRSVQLYDSAIENAPDVRKYGSEKSALLLALAEQTDAPERKLSFQQAAYEADLAAHSQNTLDRYSNFRLAASAWNLAVAGVPGKAEETVAIYEHLSEIAPAHELVAPRLDALYEATGLSPSD